MLSLETICPLVPALVPGPSHLDQQGHSSGLYPRSSGFFHREAGTFRVPCPSLGALLVQNYVDYVELKKLSQGHVKYAEISGHVDRENQICFLQIPKGFILVLQGFSTGRQENSIVLMKTLEPGG